MKKSDFSMEFFKQHKEIEQKVHENLYNNLALLTAFYPTNKEFDAVFRKDMFVKNNKGAFFEVIYYLLNILNPDLTKHKLLSWPPYDIKKEAKFRTELLSYINELNQIYENADIPACQASSLISPGGFRFAKFMFKVSQLVLYEHLKKAGQLPQLYRLKPHKNYSLLTKAQLKHLKEETKLIERETNELLKSFSQHQVDVKGKAEDITNDLTKVNKAIHIAKKELLETKTEFNLKFPTEPTPMNLEEKQVTVDAHIQKIFELDKLFQYSEKLLNKISGKNLTLEHDEENFKMPSEVSHIITNKKVLNLEEYIRALRVLLERRALELRSPTSSSIRRSVVTLNALSSKYQLVLKQLELDHDRINNMLDRLEDRFKDVVKHDDTALAVPLPLY